MPNRRWLAREQLEYYLVYLLLAYLRLIMIAGLLLLVYAIATMFMNLSTGIMVSIPAIYLLMLSNSCKVALYTARLGAWVGTLCSRDD